MSFIFSLVIEADDILGCPGRGVQRADQIAELDIRSVVINMEHAAFDQGLAQQLANHLNVPYRDQTGVPQFEQM